MEKKKLRHAQVGAWFVKGNPDKGWNYWAYRRNNPRKPGLVEEMTWSVPQDYRSQDLMRPGDKIILYMGGWTFPSVVEIGRLRDERKFVDEWDPKYVRDLRQLGRKKYLFAYDSLALQHPIPADKLHEVPGLANAQFKRAPRLGLTHLTPKELEAFTALIHPDDLAHSPW